MGNTISFHLPGSELEKWRAISEGCIAVNALTQRRSGFWAYPTTKTEVEQYYKGSNSLAFSDDEYGSYTVTWNALLASEELLAKCPAGQLREVEKGFGEMRSVGGARGSTFGGRTKRPGVAASARHTAFALLTLCRFFSGMSPREWMPSVRWLLHQQRLDTGGWCYRATDTEDEAFSTAACIAALAVFNVRYEKLVQSESGKGGVPSSEEKDVMGSIRKAIPRGIERLLRNRSDQGFWEGHLGEPNDLAGTANIIDLLSMPEVRDSVGVQYQETVKQLMTIKGALLAARKGPGWPASYGGFEPSLTTTIQVLFTVYDALLDDTHDIGHRIMQEIAAHIASELISHDGGRRLDSWDWSMLGRLCALLLARTEGRILPESQSSKVYFAMEGVRSWHSKLFRLCMLSSLQSLHLWDSSILFVSSEGRPRWEQPLVKTGRAVFYLAPFAKKAVQKYVVRKIEKQIDMP